MGLAARELNAARLLQSAVPTSVEFAAPLLVRPDWNGDEFLAHRSPLAPHCTLDTRMIMQRLDAKVAIFHFAYVDA